MSEIELDPELLADFIIESKELLEEYSANAIELESSPDDPDAVAAIFRAAHTLKGSSAFFNLVHIKNFAHKLENLLDDIRNKRRQVTDQAIDFLLTGGAFLQAMFERLSAGDHRTDLTAEEDTFLIQLVAFQEESEVSQLTVEDILSNIHMLTESFKTVGGDPAKIIVEIDTLLTEFGWQPSGQETSPGGTGADQDVFRYEYQGVDLTEPVKEAIEVMNQADEAGRLDTDAYDQALIRIEAVVKENNLHALQQPLTDTAEDFRAIRDSNMDFDQLLITMMKDKLDTLVGHLNAIFEEPPAADIPPSPEDNHIPPSESESAAKSPRDDRIERKTMRIDEDKVDGFMNYVGELIVTAETFNYLQKMIEAEKVNPHTVRAFKNANQAFRELSDELQESLMEIRRVPIKNLLQKVNLMIRELSHQMGKKVKVHIDGQEVQLDKSIAENLEGPIVHLVRNSLDHGVETPEDREKSGKSETGVIKVTASADKEFFYLEVVDDGKGIEPDKMRQAAVKKELMAEQQAQSLSDKEALHLIFSAGFSTAQEVTDISGRGVGMDVVRTNIKQLNGSINLDSIAGQGTTINLKIPLSLTLQVVKALLIRVGQEHFIISLDNILESLRPSSNELTTVEGRGEIINRRGQILPLIRLYDVFNIEPDFTNPEEAILIVMETGRGRHALMVDEVLGQQQVVVKDLDAQFKNLSFLAGSATLGDGRLGLVLETEGLVRLAQGG